MRCDYPGCDELASMGTFDNREVLSVDEWRAFEEFGPEKRGCTGHLPVSFTYYLDGRVVPTVDCLPEKLCLPEPKLSSVPEAT